MSEDENIASLVALAGHHKDRLHSLQNTEWGVYYGVWVVILSSFYFILTGSHQVLIDIAQGLVDSDFVTEKSDYLRAIRACVCTSLSLAFYLSIYVFYFVKFYPKNYRSIVESRICFYYYSNLSAERLSANYYSGKNCPIHPVDGQNCKNHLGCEVDKSASKYGESEIRKARVFIMWCMMFLGVFSVLFISYFAPIKVSSESRYRFFSVESRI